MSAAHVIYRAPEAQEMDDIRWLRYMELDRPRNLPFDPSVDVMEDELPSTMHVAAFDIEHTLALPVSTVRLEQHDEYGPYIRRMATNHLYQKQQIGRTLMRVTEGLALQLGIPQLTLHSTPSAMSFYEACGFTAVAGEYNRDRYGLYPKMTKQLM